MDVLDDTSPMVTPPEMISSSPSLTCTTTRNATELAEYEDVFRFLDLPAGEVLRCGQSNTLTRITELRNRIYDYASTKQPDERCSILPCIALAQSCQQLRTEYLPICFKADVTIDWKNLPRYIDRFYPTVGGEIQHIEQAPMKINILLPLSVGCSRDDGSVDFDLLPLIKMGLENQQVRCTFAHDGVVEESKKAVMSVDIRAFENLLATRDDRWISDIRVGNLVNVMVDYEGLDVQPLTTFVLARNATCFAGMTANEIE